MLRPGYILLSAWAVAVVGLWFGLGPRPQAKPDVWTAAHGLPRNAQLRETDLRGPEQRYRQAVMARKADLLGRHLASAKRQGEPIRPEDVMPQPSLDSCEPGSGVLAYSLKGEERLADALEVGSWVIPCYIRQGSSGNAPYSTICARTPVQVEVVHRATSSTDAIWAGLRIPSCRIQDIGEFLGREKHFLLAASAPPPARNRACIGR